MPYLKAEAALGSDHLLQRIRGMILSLLESDEVVKDIFAKCPLDQYVGVWERDMKSRGARIGTDRKGKGI